MRKRILLAAMAFALAVVALAAPVAYAAEATTLATTKADVSVDGVTLSADQDNKSGSIEGCAFAVGDFQRASKGSNRTIGDAYYGYAYALGEKSDTLMYMVTDDSVVVYVDPTAASAAGMSVDSADDIAELQKYLIALDANAGGGNALIPESATWYVTTEKVNDIGGVRYEFLKEIDNGNYTEFYNCIVGVDGSDVTDVESKTPTHPSFACYASLVPSSEVVIAAQPTWFEEVGKLVSTLDWSPLWVTLRTTFTAIVIIFILGLAAAYFCLHRTPRFRNLFDTIFTIPMVLPPTVCGFLLLLALGSNTPVGQWFIDIGFPLIFSWPATVIAAVVVAFPLMYRGALGAFDNLDPNMLDAARTLGWSEGKIFFKLMLPLSWSSIAASTVLAFARALGEFGATLFLAGNYLGITRTIPIAIYFEWMNGNTDIAIFWTIVLIIFSFLVIMFINLWSQHTTRYRKGVVEE